MASKSKVEHLADGIDLWSGDCLEVLPKLKDNSIDACITDPPYHLQTIYKRFAAKGRDETSERYAAGPYGRHATGFMGKKWDGGDIAFRPELWSEVYRVLKPGGHLLSFGGTRTYDLMCYAVRQAGFEIRDCIMWVFGSGFPKSHSVSKAIDRGLGAIREKVKHENPRNPKATGGGRDGMKGATRPWIEKAMERGYHEMDGPVPITAAAAAAAAWDGWGTALKPACEPIVLARKPLSEASVAANVLKWGTGALNIDGCRVSVADGDVRGGGFCQGGLPWPKGSIGGNSTYVGSEVGRWPANVITDGSDEVTSKFPSSSSRGLVTSKPGKIYGNGQGSPSHTGEYGFDDEGSAARFFYSAKADSKQRFQSKHPTVKPLDLMAYLCRLVTPLNGVVLDPFGGSGTTAVACLLEGFHCVMVEREAEYAADIRRRIKYADEEIAAIEKQPAFFKELIPKPKAKGFFK
jgi:DNA modification methylase